MDWPEMVLELEEPVQVKEVQALIKMLEMVLPLEELEMELEAHLSQELQVKELGLEVKEQVLVLLRFRVRLLLATSLLLLPQTR
jgi:hypothetical protein